MNIVTWRKLKRQVPTPPPPFYHRGGMSLHMRPKVNIFHTFRSEGHKRQPFTQQSEAAFVVIMTPVVI